MAGRMLRAAKDAKWWHGSGYQCGCSQCDRHGRLKRKARRQQRSREKATIRREISDIST